MKFIKGVMIGAIMSTGIIICYEKMDSSSKYKLMKKGKKFIKNLGI